MRPALSLAIALFIARSMFVRAFVILVALLSQAIAAPLSVTDEDQNNILSICFAAMKRADLTPADTMNIAIWCKSWQDKMKAAKDEPKPDPPKDK